MRSKAPALPATDDGTVLGTNGTRLEANSSVQVVLMVTEVVDVGFALEAPS